MAKKAKKAKKATKKRPRRPRRSSQHVLARVEPRSARASGASSEFSKTAGAGPLFYCSTFSCGLSPQAGRG